MHYCSIIIKDKRVSVVEARTIVGDKLVSLEKADWYSVGSYRERTFNGVQVIPLKEFKDLYIKEWLSGEPEKEKLMWDFGVVFYDKAYGNFLEYFVEERGFWEFFSWQDKSPYGNLREQLIALYYKGYKIKTLNIIDTLLANKNEEYNVVLLDYHN